MANFFDQFDDQKPESGGENFFDQFDGGSPLAPERSLRPVARGFGAPEVADAAPVQPVTGRPEASPLAIGGGAMPARTSAPGLAAPAPDAMPEEQPVPEEPIADQQPEPYNAFDMALRGDKWRPGPAQTQAPEQPTYDPFAGESFGDVAARRGQQFTQGAASVFTSIAKARGIDDRTLFSAIQSEAPDRVKEAARELARFDEILAGGVSDSGRGAMNDNERAVYQQRRDEAAMAVEQWADTAEFGPAFVGNRAKGAEATAEAIQKWTDDTFGKPPEDDSFWAQLSSGAGSMVGFALPSVLAGPAGTLVTAQMGADSAKTEAYERAIQNGASERDAQIAAQIMGFLGTSEALPIAHALNRLPESIRSDMIGRMGRFFSATAKGSIEEAVQEGGLAIVQNMVAQKVYDPNQKILTKDVGEQALVGAVLGGIMGGGANMLGLQEQRADDRADPNIEAMKGRGADPALNRATPAQLAKLTDTDRASPLADDTIAKGKAKIDEMLAANRGGPAAALNVSPEKPQTPEGVPQGAVPMSDLYDDATEAPASAPARPEAPALEQQPVAPEQESAASPGPAPAEPSGRAPEGQRSPAGDRFEDFPEIDKDGEQTGRTIRFDKETGQARVLEPESLENPAESAPKVQTSEKSPEVMDPKSGDFGTEPVSQVSQVSQPAAAETGGASRPPGGREATPSESSIRTETLNTEDVGRIETDAKTFQYKDGGDAAGVTERLQGVEGWDERAAGGGIVYEYADGRRVVVDGHQRLGLAKRLQEQGQKTPWRVEILRESDGYSAADARRIAALKNIKEGSGTAIDAAKVLRENPGEIDQLNLPPKSALVRDAKGLANLSPEAFGAVVNEVVPESYGAAVGRAVKDQKAQASVIGLLAKLKPANVRQAEMIAQQAAQTTTTETQTSLFGDEDVATNLYLERAKILDGALTRIKANKKLFKTVSENANAIAAEGNVLNQKANAKRFASEADLLEHLQSQANLKGPISDALTEAARALKGGKQTAAVVGEFLEALRRPVDGEVRPDRGSPDRQGIREQGDDAAQEVAAAPATERTDAGEQAVIPGTRDDQGADTSRAKAEAEAKAKQSKMGTTAPQGGAGPLFGDEGGTQQDMFAAPAETKATKEATKESVAATAEKRERIEDLGEKIGGARKDTAVSTGPRGSRPKEDGEKTPTWRKRYAVIQNWDLRASGEDSKKFIIIDKKTNRAVRENYRTKLFETEAEAEKFVPLAEVARNHRVIVRGDGTFEIIRTISDKKRPTIKDGFATRDDAMRYMAENATEIIETKTLIDDNIHPALEQAIREGEARREDGRDVNGQDFMDVFGFRGVEFGEWNNNAERQHILNQSYDAFLDLAEIIGVQPKAISLNGELAVAFGARGHGLSGARAHYERNYGVINLTKIKGAGSLAHEWMHALDHYFARQDGKAKSEKITNDRGDQVFNASTNAADDYASWGFRYNSGMRKEVQDGIKAVMDAIAKRRVAFVEDQSSREKISKRQIENLDKVLDEFLADIEKPQQWGTRKDAATPEQMARAKKAITKIKLNQLGEIKEAPTKAKFASFPMYEPVLELAEIYREVRGRQAYGMRQNRKFGFAVDIQNAIATKQQAKQFLDDAKAEKEKFKTVKTEFVSEAWKMDQGRSSDYWSTNHELMARAFEAYVYDRLKDVDARNDFLSYEKHNDQIAYKLFNVKPYPEGLERNDINDAFRSLFDAIQTEETPEGTVRMYQRQTRDTFAAEIMRELAANDELFAYPRSVSTDLQTMFDEIVPGVTYVGETTPDDITADAPEAERHLFRLAGIGNDKAADFYVFRTDDEVWFDVSRLEEGQGGSGLYAAMADYAKNTGRVFIGDPAGLSETALRRRNDAMLSSALKYGTTEHIEPHPDQLKGNAAIGVPPLEWTGNDLEKIQSMIKVSVDSLAHHVPEIRRARYDFKSRTFRTSEGKPISDGQLKAWSAHRRMREARAGRNSIRRAILLNTLLQAESGSRPGLLEQVLRDNAKQVEEGLKGTFYQRDEKLRAGTPQSEWLRDIILPMMPALRRELDRLGLKNVGLYIDDNAERALDGVQGMFNAYWNGRLDILIGQSLDPLATLHHEAIHALRNMGLFTDAEWKALEFRAANSWMKRYDIEGRYPDLTRAEQIEEAIAEEFAQWAKGGETPGQVAKLFEKILAFFEALRNALNGAGFQTADDVFVRALSGEVGNRPGMDMVGELAAAQMDQAKPIVTKTDAFKKWFGDSAVVDENGEPLVVYHGSKADFEEFSSSQNRHNFGGYYFTESARTASTYAGIAPEGQGQMVYPVYLSIQNPKVIRAPRKTLAEWVKQAVSSKIDADRMERNRTRDARIASATLTEQTIADLKAEGFDGIINEAGNEIVAFDATQIKSVYNRGTFDGSDPRIMYQSAYHGSPHDFDQFSTDFMGSGEGAQAFGWGLYYAGRKEVAEYYRGKLSQELRYRGKLMPRDNSWDSMAAAAWAYVLADGDKDAAKRSGLANPEKIDALDPAEIKRGGRLYTVDIPEDSEMLDWDKPLSEQPEAVREFFRAQGISWGETKAAMSERLVGLGLSKEEADDYAAKNFYDATGQMAYRELSQKLGSDRAASEALRAAGIPGHRFLDQGSRASGEGSHNYVIYDDSRVAVMSKEQRSSSKVRKLTPEGRTAAAASSHSTHIPDRSAWDELAAKNVSVLDKAAGLKGSIGDHMDKFRVKVQDRMLPLLRAEQAVEKLTGAKVDKKISPYYAEERYTTKVGYRLDDIEDRYTRPLIAMIAGAKTPIEIVDQNGETRTGEKAVSLWLMARHAKERNAHIASINDKMPDGGSGLTNDEADAILAQIAGGSHQARLDQIGALTDQLGQEMIDVREAAGLLSAQDALIWRRQYKHYVPLRKFAEDDMYDGILNEGGTGMGRRYNVRGSEARQALGRDTEAFDPLVMLITQAQEVAVRAEKNAVAKAMFDFAATNPNPAMWEVSTPETQRFFNQATGKVETRVVGPAARQLAENEMALKIDGKERRIAFKDPRLAKAMGQIGTNELDIASRAASKFSRFFSTVNTMLSPPFMIVNAFRDMITAEVNLGAAGGQIAGKLRKAALRDWIKSFGGAYKGQGKNPGTGQYAQWFKEYSEAGGKISFWAIEDPEGAKTDFEKRVKRASRNKLTGTAMRLVLPSTRDNPVLAWIERVNLSVDNAVRLSVYVEARKNGWSKEDAASLSKNLTVNFNRRGEIGATMNAWYPFANAAIQGSHVILKAMKTKQVRRLVGGMFLFGIANDLLNAALSAEDDDGELEYDQLPNYVSERNIILAVPGSDKGFVTVPLPYGFNVFFYAGQQLGKVMRGVKNPGEASGQVFMATIGAFSPLSGETGYQMAMPTLFDFANELNTNRDWLGRPIRPENPYGDYGPQAYKEFNASAPSRFIAQGLNAATGGNVLEPGLIDVSPEYIDHIAKFLTGGAGRFAGQVGGIAERAVEGTLGDIETYEIPLAKTLVTSSGDFLNQNRYFEFREAVNEARAQRKLSAETGAPMTDDMKRLNGLWSSLSRAEKARKDINSRMDGIYADDRLSARARELKLRPLKKRRNDLYVEFNRAFIASMGPQAE